MLFPEASSSRTRTRAVRSNAFRLPLHSPAVCGNLIEQAVR